MHTEALTFVAKVVGPLDLSTKRVLDIGSYDVNGSPRVLFAASPAYVGIDRRDGAGVDVVSEAKDYQPDDGETFDIAVSCETLEHADTPADVIDCAWRSLKVGGLLILTAAGPDREPHGVDGMPLHLQGGPYTVIDKKLLGKLLADWQDVSIEYGASHGGEKGDIYATAVKPSARAAKRETKADAVKDEGA